MGYIRVSTETQDVKNQRHEILEYANNRGFRVDEFIEIQISSRKDSEARGIDGLLERLKAGDVLIVSELSRVGRSVVEVITIINGIIRKQVRFIAQSFPMASSKEPTLSLSSIMVRGWCPFGRHDLSPFRDA